MKAKWWEEFNVHLSTDYPLVPSYEELAQRTRAILEKLTPVQLATMRERQRLDFVYGNTKLSNPAITREIIADACDRQDGIVRSDT